MLSYHWFIFNLIGVNMKLPIFSDSDGRTIIGYAEGERSAGIAIRRLLSIPIGFSLKVWRRRDNMRDLLDLPDGFVYSIYKTY
jgi:hypothetical protein